MVKLRPRGPRGVSRSPSWPSGMPKRLKKRSIGEPGGNGESPSKLIVRGAAVDLDADRDHRGLHLLDDVGKADRALRGLGVGGARKERGIAAW